MCRPTSEYYCRAVRTGLSACFAYLVGVGAVDAATDFGPTVLRLTGVAEVLVEVSASAYFLVEPSAWRLLLP